MTPTLDYTSMRKFIQSVEKEFGAFEWTNVRYDHKSTRGWGKYGGSTPQQTLTEILSEVGKAALSVSLYQHGPHVAIHGRDASGTPRQLALILNQPLTIWSDAHHRLMEREAA